MPFKGVIPATKVVPAPFGLFSVANVTRKSSADEHWIGGFDVETEACAFNAQIVDVCGGEAPIPVYDNDGERSFKITPFGITATDECLSQGFSVDDRRARVIRQLELVTPKAVETELWNGLYRQAVDGGATGRYLSSSAATTVEATAVAPHVGVALLEQALANCGAGYQGVIHMSPLVASALGPRLVQSSDGKQLTTFNGNLVASGAGYDGRGPGATAAPTDKYVHWVYATGPVAVDLGANEVITMTPAQATNPSTNVMTYVAERPVTVYWDGCCHLAVQVDVRL